MKRPIPTGLLVAVEGIDGAGKTSVATHLAQWCGERGLACTISKEPTGLKWGHELRSSAKEGRLPLEREIELFIADRRDHVSRCISPSLAEENIVILDRYYWSSAAYQGSRGANYDEIMARNEEFAPRPDLVMVLDLDVDCGLQRIRMRGDKPNLFEAKPSLLRARQIFGQLAERNCNARLVDTGGHMRESFDAALRAFQTSAVKKIVSAGLSRDEMVRRTLEFFGGEQIATEDPAGLPETNALLAEARKASQ